MIEGKIRHNVLEIFSNNEKDFVMNFVSAPENMEKEYQKLLNELIHHSFLSHSQLIKSFSISPEDLKEKIIDSMKQDISLRSEIIEKTMSQGFIGPELWHNIKPKYLSEFFIESELLGLRGRIDRVMFAEELIVPFELKTREIEKIYESDEIQLTSYAMLLEEKYQKPISFGVIEAGNTKHEMQITEKNKKKVIELIKEINNVTNNPKFPSNFRKCQSCPWQEQCDKLGDKKDF